MCAVIPRAVRDGQGGLHQHPIMWPCYPILVGLTALLHSKKLSFVAVWLDLLSFVLGSWEDKLLDFLHIIWLLVLWAPTDKLRNNNLRI